MGIERGDNQIKDRPLFGLLLWGVEASHMSTSGWTGELSYIALTDGGEVEKTFALRAGKTFPVHATHAISGHLFPFAGYRYAPRPDYNNDGRSDIHVTHNVHLGLGYGLQSKKTGIVLLRLSAGSDLVLSSRFALYYSEDSPEPGRRSSRYSGFVNASLGVAIEDLFR
jgi:hypothetical protein